MIGNSAGRGLTGWRVQEREMAMVQFIMRADNPEVPPPYDFPNMTIMSFRLPATVANLQRNSLRPVAEHRVASAPPL